MTTVYGMCRDGQPQRRWGARNRLPRLHAGHCKRAGQREGHRAVASGNRTASTVDM